MDEKIDILRLMENVIFIKKYTLFSDLDTEEIRALALIAREVVVLSGECVVRENDPGDSFFILKNGRLRIMKGSGESGVVLTHIEKYACFGEMALFEEGLLRSASIFAEGDCSLLVFHRDELFEAMILHPGISLELLKIFGKRLRESNEKLHALSIKESHS